MFVDYSEISVSVIVKHVHNFEIIRTFCLTGETFFSFSVHGKIMWFAGGNQYPGRHYGLSKLHPLLLATNPLSPESHIHRVLCIYKYSHNHPDFPD